MTPLLLILILLLAIGAAVDFNDECPYCRWYEGRPGGSR